MSWSEAERRGCDETHRRLDMEIKGMKRHTETVEVYASRKLSRWTAGILIVILIAVVGACYAIAGGALSRTATQGERTRAVEIQAEANAKRLDRIDDKLDQILAAVRADPGH